MGFFDWFSRKKKGTKIAIIASAIALSAAYYTIIKNATNEYAEMRKDPIVKLVVNNSEKYSEMLNLAQSSVESNDVVGIQESLEEIEKADNELGSALSDNSDLTYLKNKGWLTSGQITVAENFRKQIGDVKTELSKKLLELKK
jgi:hypothetical protein